MASASHPPAVDGQLRLRLVNRRGATTIAGQVVTAPFKVFRPQALPDGSLVLQVCMLGPGLRSGDQYRIELLLESGAKALLLFPSAAKVLGAVNGVPAVQECRFEVAGGAQLEYYPGLTIPFPRAAFHQSIEASLERGAHFGILEMWAAGRVERGEELQFCDLQSRTSVSVEGRPAYIDTLRMRPHGGGLDGPGVLEGHRYWASGYWHWDGRLEQPDVACDGLELVTGQPPHGSLYLRGLAQDGVALRRRVHEILARQRQAWGLSPVDFGRYTNLFS
jgi:urease accessory protein